MRTSRTAWNNPSQAKVGLSTSSQEPRHRVLAWLKPGNTFSYFLQRLESVTEPGQAGKGASLQQGAGRWERRWGTQYSKAFILGYKAPAVRNPRENLSSRVTRSSVSVGQTGHMSEINEAQGTIMKGDCGKLERTHTQGAAAIQLHPIVVIQEMCFYSCQIFWFAAEARNLFYMNIFVL